MKKKLRKYLINDYLTKFTFDDFLKKQEEIRIENNIEIIDENFEELAEYIGRGLTVQEESALLDVIDEITPKDSNGDYVAGLVPFEFAWEVYEAKRETNWNKFKKLINL